MIKLKRANKITINPAVLKKIPDLELFPIEKELNESNPKTGSVPKANESMVNAPCIKLPVESATICIDWVKPQGKKKVTTPTRSGVRV